MEQLDENALNIYTDGSSYSSPRVGGFGFVFIGVDDRGDEQVHEEAPPGWKGATNNQMELQACIEALGIALGKHPPFEISRFDRIVIRTDSQYVSENWKRAMFQWSRNRWKTRTGGPVLNTPQWKQLLRLIKRARDLGVRVDIRWVKGHKGDSFNKRADRLAKHSAKMPATRKPAPKRIRRKKSALQVEPGSVRMLGQVLTVRIVTDEYLRSPHRLYRYQYEVVDLGSSYDEAVDYATSEMMLGAGHTYRVRFNDDDGNPQIAEVLEEVTDVQTRGEG